jgi:hypothetical protein
MHVATVQRTKRLRASSVSARGGSTRSLADIAIESTAAILTSRREDLEHLYQMPGGWELWLHSELYVALRKATLVPLSEDKSYGDARRADLAFVGEDGNSGIELKCESLWNQAGFLGEVSKDSQKIQDWQGGAIVQMAISVSEANTKEAPNKMWEWGLKPVSQPIPASGNYAFTLHYATIVRGEEGL